MWIRNSIIYAKFDKHYIKDIKNKIVKYLFYTNCSKDKWHFTIYFSKNYQKSRATIK